MTQPESTDDARPPDIAFDDDDEPDFASEHESTSVDDDADDGSEATGQTRRP